MWTVGEASSSSADSLVNEHADKKTRALTGKADPTKLLPIDIWIHILSFVGPGHFLFVAGVNWKMKACYRASFYALARTPSVKVSPLEDVEKRTYNGLRPARLDDTFYRAVFSSVACANYWYNNRKQGHLEEEAVCGLIARYGNLEVLKWASLQGYDWDEDTCEEAACNGHLELLKYAHANGCPWDGWTCHGAAENGHLECLMYAHQNQCPWGEHICEAASQNGHLDCLQYAHRNGCPMDESCTRAAENGNLECLIYAHEKGFPWNELTCSGAAMNGHMDCLQYAHKHGCPWDFWTCKYARENGHYAIAEWAYRKGCPWDGCEAVQNQGES